MSNSTNFTEPCRLCVQRTLSPLCSAHQRSYWICGTCQIILMDEQNFLTAAEERARYQLHENNSDDPAYRNFLNRTAEPLARVLPSGACGLDYGCGPGPTLAMLLGEHGFRLENYDPLFFPDQTLLERRYDFVVSTEVFEHFRNPRTEIEHILGLLRPGGMLAVMTEMRTDRAFPDWHYPRDPTHVAFYTEETMRWIAGNWKLEFEPLAKNVSLFRAKTAE